MIPHQTESIFRQLNICSLFETKKIKRKHSLFYVSTIFPERMHNAHIIHERNVLNCVSLFVFLYKYIFISYVFYGYSSLKMFTGTMQCTKMFCYFFNHRYYKSTSARVLVDLYHKRIKLIVVFIRLTFKSPN